MMVNNENKNQSEESDKTLWHRWNYVQIGSGFLSMVPLAQNGIVMIGGGYMYLYDTKMNLIESAPIINCDVYTNFWTKLGLNQLVLLRMRSRTYSLSELIPESRLKPSFLDLTIIGQIKNARMFRSEFKRLKAKATSNQ
jgi:hypothetical protein